MPDSQHPYPAGAGGGARVAHEMSFGSLVLRSRLPRVHARTRSRHKGPKATPEAIPHGQVRLGHRGGGQAHTGVRVVPAHHRLHTPRSFARGLIPNLRACPVTQRAPALRSGAQGRGGKAGSRGPAGGGREGGHRGWGRGVWVRGGRRTMYSYPSSNAVTRVSVPSTGRAKASITMKVFSSTFPEVPPVAVCEGGRRGGSGGAVSAGGYLEGSPSPRCCPRSERASPVARGGAPGG